MLHQTLLTYKEDTRTVYSLLLKQTMQRERGRACLLCITNNEELAVSKTNKANTAMDQSANKGYTA